MFSSCGDVKYAEMKERGTGMVRFNTERDAERAVGKINWFSPTALGLNPNNQLGEFN